MSYPVEDPKYKHDLTSSSSFSLSSGELVPFYDLNLHESNNNSNVNNNVNSNVNSNNNNNILVEALQRSKLDPLKFQKKLIASVYLYSDAPVHPMPLCRALGLIGFCDMDIIGITHTHTDTDTGTLNASSTSSVSPKDAIWNILSSNNSNCIDNDDDIGICSVAVKRADGAHKSNLKSSDVDNSNRFDSLCQQLRIQQKVAIFQCSKTYKCIFLIPTLNRFSHNNNMHIMHKPSDSYAAYLYYGKEQLVTNMMISIQAQPQQEQEQEMMWQPSTPPPPPDEKINDDENDHLWQPNPNKAAMDDDNNVHDQLWKPTTTDTNTNTSTTTNDNAGNNMMDLWEPPSSSSAMLPSTDSTAFNEEPTSNLWQPFNTDDSNNNSNIQNDNNNSNSNNNDTKETLFHSNSGAAAADLFYSTLTRSLNTRSESILYHMRNFNGWVKATQIAELDPNTIFNNPSTTTTTTTKNNTKKSSKKRKRTNHPLRILDLACGKGGDLGKWILQKRGIQSYVGSDVARGSLVDAAIRARNMKDKLKNRCTFICADLGSDVPGRPRSTSSTSTSKGGGVGGGGKIQKLLTWSLQNDNPNNEQPQFELISNGIHPTDKFDVVSIQFAIHYMMQTEKRARRFFQTVSELLDIGGNLIATTIDARIVMDHMMDTGFDFDFDDDDSDSNGKKKDEYLVIKVGKNACQLKFHRDIVKKIISNSQSTATNTNIINNNNNNNTTGKINPDLFGLEYTFTLIEGEDHAAGVGQAVDLPEWLTPLPVLKQLAHDAGLTMEYASNFHEFYQERKDPILHRAAHNALRRMNVLNWKGTISNQEWDISRMYVAVKFRKERDSTVILEDDDYEEPEEEEEEGDDVDNNNIIINPEGDQTQTNEEHSHKQQQQQHSTSLEAQERGKVISTSSSTAAAATFEINMKDPKVMIMYTSAMKKARESCSEDAWKALSSNEKKIRINIELSKMMQTT